MHKEKTKVWINGLSGKMGQVLSQQIKIDKNNWNLLGGSSLEDFVIKKNQLLEAHLVIDFSSRDGSEALARFVEKSSCPPMGFLICSTGLKESTLATWKKLAHEKNLRVLIAPNTSLGIALALKSSLLVSSTLLQNNFDIEIEETHHKHKKDLPSGTALYLADHLAQKNNLKINKNRNTVREKNEIGIQASRGGGVFGEHKIRFLGEHEEITIMHRSYSRDLFAQGAMYLGQWLVNKKECGLYELFDVHQG